MNAEQKAIYLRESPRADAAAIWAACEAVHGKGSRWPGWSNIQVAVDAYLKAVGSRVVPERRKQTKDRRVTLERRGRVTATLDRRQA